MSEKSECKQILVVPGEINSVLGVFQYCIYFQILGDWKGMNSEHWNDDDSCSKNFRSDTIL
jgi:hypothetical protein